ncbi:fumarylacetoacetate hydrolase family protein [Streptomyces sp. NPDC001553]|uniref:2-keto-4-pentenoate hydratase n=1 Tax=Streptomyces sp. NPDC001553 TaxID=3154385 RepID=UPI003321D59C
MVVKRDSRILMALLEPCGPDLPPADLDGPHWAQEEALRLHKAELDRLPSALLSCRRPGVALDEAYLVQWVGAAQRVRQGAQVIGHKVGLTSEAMQAQFGIDQPDSGLLLDRMVVTKGHNLPVGDLLAPRVEGEIAFRLAADVRGEDVGEEEVRDAVGECLLALEVIDSRYGVEGLTLVDSVADNAACARIVLGRALSGVPEDLADELLTLTVDGTIAASGYGRAVLGDPVRSLLWLVRRLHSFGAGLRAGDVVLAGAVHASLPLRPGQTVALSSPRFPEAVLHAA